jgi:hypothetical protein
MKKSVLAFGFDLPDLEGFETLNFSSDRSMLDADVIAAELSLAEFHLSGQSYAGTPIISESSSFSYRKTVESWKRQLDTALSLGKTVVLFLTTRTDRHFYTGSKKNIGTAARPQMSATVAPCSNYDLLPVILKNPQFVNGTSIRLDPAGDIISDYWKKFEQYSCYKCFFEEGGKPLLLTKSGGHIVGCHWSKVGNLLLLPELNWDRLEQYESEPGTRDWPESYIDFTRDLRNALIDIDHRLKKDKEITPAPAWAEAAEFRLGTETALENEIVKLEIQISALAIQCANLRNDLEQKGALRRLLFEGGHALESAVREALRILGFTADNFKEDGSEFDALFTSPEGRFLAEVEGKETKAINVDKLSQLHRNITEDFSRDDVKEPAIPVLFGNAFRTLPPQDRAGFFTEKVLRFASTANIALVRTTDLFTAARYVEENADEVFARTCRIAIKEGVGGIVNFPEAPPLGRNEILAVEDCSATINVK